MHFFLNTADADILFYFMLKKLHGVLFTLAEKKSFYFYLLSMIMAVDKPGTISIQKFTFNTCPFMVFRL